MKKKISNKIKYLNFLFTLAIVFYHFKMIYPFNINYLNKFDNYITNLFLDVVDKFGYISMVFFFILSGFLYYFNINKPLDDLKKMKKRIKTLLVPYLLWFLIILFYLIITNNIKINFFMDFINKIFFNPIDGPMWYCLALLLLMIPSPLIIKLKNKKMLSTICLLCMLVWLYLRSFGIIKPLFEFSEWWWYGNMISYLQSYIIGVYLGLNFSSYIANPIKQNKYIKILCGILILPLVMLSVKVTNFAFKQLFYIGIIVCLWYLFDFKYLKHQKESHGNISFFLFAIHQPILIPKINRLFSLMFKNSVFAV